MRAPIGGVLRLLLAAVIGRALQQFVTQVVRDAMFAQWGYDTCVPASLVRSTLRFFTLRHAQ